MSIEKLRQVKRKWKAEHKGRVNEIQRKHYQKYKETLKEKQKLKYRLRPEVLVAQVRVRRMKT